MLIFCFCNTPSHPKHTCLGIKDTHLKVGVVVDAHIPVWQVPEGCTGGELFTPAGALPSVGL